MKLFMPISFVMILALFFYICSSRADTVSGNISVSCRVIHTDKPTTTGTIATGYDDKGNITEQTLYLYY